MSSFNRFIVVGNLTRNPEPQTLDTGLQLTRGGIALNHSFTKADGTRQDQTCFVDFVMFGKTAESFGSFFADGKGRLVLLEGRLSSRNWQADSGERRTRHELVVERWAFMDPRPMEAAQKPTEATSGWVGPDTTTGWPENPLPSKRRSSTLVTDSEGYHPRIVPENKNEQNPFLRESP